MSEVPRREGHKKREGTLPLLSMSAHLAIAFAWEGCEGRASPGPSYTLPPPMGKDSLERETTKKVILHYFDLLRFISFAYGE